MFTKFMINKLKEKGYYVLTQEEMEPINELDSKYNKAKRVGTRITKKYNDLLNNYATKLTIKELKEQLIAFGVENAPSKKSELIELYVKTFEE